MSREEKLSTNQILSSLNAIYSKQSIWKTAEVLKASAGGGNNGIFFPPNIKRFPVGDKREEAVPGVNVP